MQLTLGGVQSVQVLIELAQALVQATGTLEGSLSAFRHLTNEIARTIDDGIELLAR